MASILNLLGLSYINDTVFLTENFYTMDMFSVASPCIKLGITFNMQYIGGVYILKCFDTCE